MKVQCCKCKRVRVNGRWQPATMGAERPMSHSYCPECLLEATVEMFNERASDNDVQQARDLLNSLAVMASS